LSIQGSAPDWLDRSCRASRSGYDPPQHLFVFSLDGLRRSLAAAGLRLGRPIPVLSDEIAQWIRIAAAPYWPQACGLRWMGRIGAASFRLNAISLGNLMSIVAGIGLG